MGVQPGEVFIHRNIANLVPGYAPDGEQHGTSAAVEYAVNTLKVAHLVVMGHTKCGAVAHGKPKCDFFECTVGSCDAGYNCQPTVLVPPPPPGVMPMTNPGGNTVFACVPP